MSGLWITLAALALIILFFISLYNRLVALKNKVENAFGQIDVQLKRRHDLIPNLVETARSYMLHERTTLEAVINARNTAQTAGQLATQRPEDAQALAAMAQAEGALSSTLGRFFALAEAYPDLKANQNMMQLSEELTTTENKVAFARQAFNDAVMALNTAIQSFPAVVFAGALGFSQIALLQPLESEAERKAPVVRF
ncbi:LemA family protein [Thiothrix lacustris]|uniref:LemA family protein n=1 Tax=Thiothrix lacustris TaxID=525917 RepID=A0ABY9MLP8_9GAMM|nr:LemA family protein [Thiothrix lacustris]WML89473.1 LemA family protein [Thiothrix lacustris]